MLYVCMDVCVCVSERFSLKPILENKAQFKNKIIFLQHNFSRVYITKYVYAYMMMIKRYMREILCADN